MPYPTPSKALQVKRLANTPGKGVGAGGTGHGTADINVPEMPPPPLGLSEFERKRWREDWGRWRENLAAQFPIPMVQSETVVAAPTEIITEKTIETRVEVIPQEMIDRVRQGADNAIAANADLENRVNVLEETVYTLINRVIVLEGLLLNLAPEHILGRHSSTAGPAQIIKIGPGLLLAGDTLVNTGGGGAVTAFTTGFNEGFG